MELTKLYTANLQPKFILSIHWHKELDTASLNCLLKRFILQTNFLQVVSTRLLHRFQKWGCGMVLKIMRHWFCTNFPLDWGTQGDSQENDWNLLTRGNQSWQRHRDTFNTDKPSARRTKANMANSQVIPWTIKWNSHFNSLLPLWQHGKYAQTLL